MYIARARAQNTSELTVRCPALLPPNRLVGLRGCVPPAWLSQFRRTQSPSSRVYYAQRREAGGMLSKFPPSSQLQRRHTYLHHPALLCHTLQGPDRRYLQGARGAQALRAAPPPRPSEPWRRTPRSKRALPNHPRSPRSPLGSRQAAQSSSSRPSAKSAAGADSVVLGDAWLAQAIRKRLIAPLTGRRARCPPPQSPAGCLRGPPSAAAAWPTPQPPHDPPPSFRPASPQVRPRRALGEAPPPAPRGNCPPRPHHRGPEPLGPPLRRPLPLGAAPARLPAQPASSVPPAPAQRRGDLTLTHPPPAAAVGRPPQGCLLIAFRADKLRALGLGLERGLEWEDLWRPELRGRVAFPDEPRTLLGVTFKAAGLPFDLPQGQRPQGAEWDALQERLRALRRQASAREGARSGDGPLRPAVPQLLERS